MNIVIRTDASVMIGTGHVMRCLTLAGLLRQQGNQVTFVCRELDGHLCDYIDKCGYTVHRLPYASHLNLPADSSLYARWLAVPLDQEIDEMESICKDACDIDWLIVDHYALDFNWEIRLRKYVNQIMAIDDLANRRHDCDVLLDQNLYEDVDTRYAQLVKPGTGLLLGPEFALLREEFQTESKTKFDREEGISRLLVFYGGTDPTNETAKGLTAITQLGKRISDCDVVVGESNPRQAEIKNLCDQSKNLRFHKSVDNMARLMSRADLALGAPGSSTWERCCMGLPSLTTAIADNQIRIGQSTNLFRFGKYLGHSCEVTADILTNKLADLIDRPEEVIEMSRRGMELVDGLGSQRVCKAMTVRTLAGAKQ